MWRTSFGPASGPGTSISRRRRCGSCSGRGSPRRGRSGRWRSKARAAARHANGAAPRGAAPFVSRYRGRLQLHDVLSGGALLALNHFELDSLAFGQGLEAILLDRGVMHEAVLFAVLGRDEAEALRVVEPLHGTGDAWHTGGTPDLVFATARGFRLAARRGLVLPPSLSGPALVEALALQVLEQTGPRNLPAELLQDPVQSVVLAQRDFHRPRSRREAHQKRKRTGDEAQVLGQSLVFSTAPCRAMSLERKVRMRDQVCQLREPNVVKSQDVKERRRGGPSRRCVDASPRRLSLTHSLDVVSFSRVVYRTASWHPSEGRSRSGAGLTSVGSILRFATPRDVEKRRQGTTSRGPVVYGVPRRFSLTVFLDEEEDNVFQCSRACARVIARRGRRGLRASHPHSAGDHPARPPGA